MLKAETSRLSRQGPPPDEGASGAVATLSDLLADFSRQLAQALREATSGQAAPWATTAPSLSETILRIQRSAI